MNQEFEIGVYRLIAALDPTRDQQLLEAAAEWLTGFAARLPARLNERAPVPGDRREIGR